MQISIPGFIFPVFILMYFIVFIGYCFWVFLEEFISEVYEIN